MDFTTDFQRANVITSITDGKTSLIKNRKTNEFEFIDEPNFIEGFINYHLHILFPKFDIYYKRENTPSKGNWVIESLTKSIRRNGELIGPYLKPIIFNPEIHSKNCNKILASTENLLGNNPDWDTTDFKEYPGLDKTKIKDVYNICNSLVEEYVKMQGKLSHVMVQPLYGNYPNLIVDDIEYDSELVDYKLDSDNFIAVFPSKAYNKASLVDQIY